jgi:ribonucleotide monophosphatase NagD (HAD superfamily)
MLPVGTGVEPETGAVIAFLEAASGQTAYVVGKPNKVIFQQALAKLSCAAEAVAVVGDTAATDIAGATASGLRSIQLASGNPGTPGEPHQPTLHMASLVELAERLEN